MAYNIGGVSCPDFPAVRHALASAAPHSLIVANQRVEPFSMLLEYSGDKHITYHDACLGDGSVIPPNELAQFGMWPAWSEGMIARWNGRPRLTTGGSIVRVGTALYADGEQKLTERMLALFSLHTEPRVYCREQHDAAGVTIRACWPDSVTAVNIQNTLDAILAELSTSGLVSPQRNLAPFAR